MATLLKRFFTGETALEVLHRELKKYVGGKKAQEIIDTKIGWANKI